MGRVATLTFLVKIQIEEHDLGDLQGVKSTKWNLTYFTQLIDPIGWMVND